jgi:signal-transduction protein with cAMP-binding, CBS, and nucleotidyltransferase domain
MTKIEVLSKCDVFKMLNDEELHEIEKMCEVEEFEAGAIVCKQGNKEKNLYVIEHGTVGIILEVGPLAQRQVQAVTDFEVFGWSAMLEPYICTATVKALEGTKVSRGIARVVASRLRQAYTQLLGVTSQL